MQPDQNLLQSLQKITQNFLSHEQKALSEAPKEFQILLQKTLQETIEELFLQEMTNIISLKSSLTEINGEIDSQTQDFNRDLDVFLQNLNENIIPDAGFYEESKILKKKLMKMINSNKAYPKTVKKVPLERKSAQKTPTQKSYFPQRPRSANVLFMEKRLKEMALEGEGNNESVWFKEKLKGLVQEWKGLKEEEKKEFEEAAEKEFNEYMGFE